MSEFVIYDEHDFTWAPPSGTVMATLPKDVAVVAVAAARSNASSFSALAPPIACTESQSTTARPCS